jgi:hypothetical protein
LRLGSGPYHGSVKINLSEHARRRLREKGLTVADIRKTCSRAVALPTLAPRVTDAKG